MGEHIILFCANEALHRNHHRLIPSSVHRCGGCQTHRCVAGAHRSDIMYLRRGVDVSTNNEERMKCFQWNKNDE